MRRCETSTVDVVRADPASAGLAILGGELNQEVERVPFPRRFPRVTIATIVEDIEDDIATTISSVLDHNYPSIDYIIVDVSSGHPDLLDLSV